MKKILAIGGAVIKTAQTELRQVIKQGKVEVLIHNGGSIFHDFQLATEKLKSHSYPIDELLKDHSCNENSSHDVWNWIDGDFAPRRSITKLCEDNQIPVLLFTGHACDFWQLYGDSEEWADLATNTFWNSSYCEETIFTSILDSLGIISEVANTGRPGAPATNIEPLFSALISHAVPSLVSTFFFQKPSKVKCTKEELIFDDIRLIFSDVCSPFFNSTHSEALRLMIAAKTRIKDIVRFIKFDLIG